MSNGQLEHFGNEFWDQAFDPAQPFYEELRTEFRRGLVDGNEEDLNWARLGLHGIRAQAVWPLLARLIEHAGRLPRAEFVEALALYISNPAAVVHSAQARQLLSNALAQRVESGIDQLCRALESYGEKDLVGRLREFQTQVRQLRQSLA